jgi:hypothetical protein
LSSQDKQVRDALETFSDGLEAISVQLRQNLGLATKKEDKAALDLSKINWRDMPGTEGKGPFKMAQEDANDQNPVFDALRKHLFENKGKTTIDGNFVWLFPDQKAIGMKSRKKAVPA